jgi:hypothetical protein
MAVDDQRKRDVEIKYESLRRAARDATVLKARIGRFGNNFGVDLKKVDVIHISDAATADAADWNFPWRRIVGQTRPYLRRFEVAFWTEGRLLALAVGRVSRGNDNVTIHYLERAKDNNPLATNVAALVVDMAENYAKLLGKQRVKLKNPNPALTAKYEALGFSLAETYRGATYYERKVNP